METDPVSEMLCFLVFRIPGDGQRPEITDCMFIFVSILIVRRLTVD
jgi:hypothetical protein